MRASPEPTLQAGWGLEPRFLASRILRTVARLLGSLYSPQKECEAARMLSTSGSSHHLEKILDPQNLEVWRKPTPRRGGGWQDLEVEGPGQLSWNLGERL